MKHVFVIIFSFLLFACNNQPGKKQETNLKTMGTIERMDASLDNIISAGAQPEIIADGFEWSEGPLWIEQHNMLLFSDVPTNTVYKWTEEKGKEIYLNPSGYTDSVKRGGEMGSNGLTLDTKSNLVLCQHGKPVGSGNTIYQQDHFTICFYFVHAVPANFFFGIIITLRLQAIGWIGKK